MEDGDDSGDDEDDGGCAATTMDEGDNVCLLTIFHSLDLQP